MKCLNASVLWDYQASTVQSKPVQITAQEVGPVLKESAFAMKGSQATIVVKKHALMIVQETANAILLLELAFATNCTGEKIVQKKVVLMIAQGMASVWMECASVMQDLPEKTARSVNASSIAGRMENACEVFALVKKDSQVLPVTEKNA